MSNLGRSRNVLLWPTQTFCTDWLLNRIYWILQKAPYNMFLTYCFRVSRLPTTCTTTVETYTHLMLSKSVCYYLGSSRTVFFLFFFLFLLYTKSDPWILLYKSSLKSWIAIATNHWPFIPSLLINLMMSVDTASMVEPRELACLLLLSLVFFSLVNNFFVWDYFV